MRAQAQDAPPLQLPALRVVASVGEPLNAEAVEGSAGPRTCCARYLVADRDRRDHDRLHAPSCIAAGAMGQPLAGLRAHVVKRLGRGALEVLDDRAEVEGELAFEAGWPGCFEPISVTRRITRLAFAKAST